MERLGRCGIEVQRFLHRLVRRFEVAAGQRRARQLQLMLEGILRSTGMDRLEGGEHEERGTEPEDGRNLNPAACNQGVPSFHRYHSRRTINGPKEGNQREGGMRTDWKVAANQRHSPAM